MPKAVRTFILILAVLTSSVTMISAQTAPKPQDPGGAPSPGNTVTTPDPDKTRVQDRWSTSTGDTTSNTLTKKGKPQTTNTSEAPK